MLSHMQNNCIYMLSPRCLVILCVVSAENRDVQVHKGKGASAVCREAEIAERVVFV